MSSAIQPYPVHEPTPDDIESTCARIRAGWSQRVRERRAGRTGREAAAPVQVTTAFPLDRRRASSPMFLDEF